MNTSSAAVMSNREFFRQKVYVALHRIPGVYEMIHSNADQQAMLEKKYPDAAFTMYIVSNLFFHDRDLTSITYTDILNGERIEDIRFRYERDVKNYMELHFLDD